MSILICKECGGHWSTTGKDILAEETKCLCDFYTPSPSGAPPEIRSGEWVAARRETKELRKHLKRLVEACKQVSAALDAEMAKPSDVERGKRIAKITNFLDWEKDYASHFGLGKPVRPKKPSAATMGDQRPP